MIFVVINQTNKHKVKIYSQYKYTQIIMKVFINIKKFSSKYKNGKFIIKLKLIAQNRNINDYENKSKKELVKVISEPKPKIVI